MALAGWGKRSYAVTHTSRRRNDPLSLRNERFQPSNRQDETGRRARRAARSPPRLPRDPGMGRALNGHALKCPIRIARRLVERRGIRYAIVMADPRNSCNYKVVDLMSRTR